MNMKNPPASWIEVDNNWHSALPERRCDNLQRWIHNARRREKRTMWADGHTPLVPAQVGTQLLRKAIRRYLQIPAYTGMSDSGARRPLLGLQVIRKITPAWFIRSISSNFQALFHFLS
jgi:hypothetical protein